jgi:nicotinamidase-related amidase
MSRLIAISALDLLVVIDVQNDFCPEGALAVPHGDDVVPVINRLTRVFPHVCLTQDWHPQGHVSFASSHEGRRPFESIALSYGDQVLWPDHCRQGTKGADFHPDLDTSAAEAIVRKGFHKEIDSYSALWENDHKTPTGFAGYLRNRGFRRLFLAGLATDFCVLYTALDLCREGFETLVIEEAVRGINVDDSVARAWRAMDNAGVRRIGVQELSL